MITENRKHLRWIWFADKPKWHLLSVYLQTKDKVSRWTHIRKPFPTMVLDLTLSEEKIRASYAPKNAYKIRRAAKDDLAYDVSKDEETLIRLFNQTAEAKGLEGLSREKLTTKPESAITQVSKEKEVLAMHYYLVDKEQGIVLLLYAASAYRNYTDPKKRYLAGRAHRLLFDRDFLHFKQLGYRQYDFGGYDPNSRDPVVQGVNKFKEDFGGRIVQQFHYYPIWYYVFRQLRALLQKYRRRL